MHSFQEVLHWGQIEAVYFGLPKPCLYQAYSCIIFCFGTECKQGKGHHLSLLYLSGLCSDWNHLEHVVQENLNNKNIYYCQSTQRL